MAHPSLLPALRRAADAGDALSGAAADEIERLCGVCKDKTDLLFAAYEQRNARDAENERLRAALREACDMLETASSGYIPRCGEDEQWHAKRDELVKESRALEQTGDGK